MGDRFYESCLKCGMKMVAIGTERQPNTAGTKEIASIVYECPKCRTVEVRPVYDSI